jgi:hypothetical protein
MKVCPNKVSNASNTKFKVYLDFNIKTNGSFWCLESIVRLAQLKQEDSRIWFWFFGRRVQIHHQVDLKLFFPIFEHYRFYFGTCKMARLTIYEYFISINVEQNAIENENLKFWRKYPIAWEATLLREPMLASLVSWSRKFRRYIPKLQALDKYG